MLEKHDQFVRVSGKQNRHSTFKHVKAYLMTSCLHSPVCLPVNPLVKSKLEIRNDLLELKIENIFSENEQLALEMLNGNMKQTKHVAKIGEISGARFFSL